MHEKEKGDHFPATAAQLALLERFRCVLGVCAYPDRRGSGDQRLLEQTADHVDGRRSLARRYDHSGTIQGDEVRQRLGSSKTTEANRAYSIGPHAEQPPRNAGRSVGQP